MATGLRANPALHCALGYVHLAALTVGSSAALLYAGHQSYGGDRDGGFAGQVSFAFMALACCVPAWTGAAYAALWGDVETHREWMLRSYATLLGSFFLFRALARWYLPYAPDRYSGWLPMVFASWVLPSWLAEQFIAARISRTRRTMTRHNHKVL